MAGSIRKRGENSWEIQITLGKDPVTGKKKRIYKTVKGTKKEAEKVLREILHQVDHGILCVSRRVGQSPLLI